MLRIALTYKSPLCRLFGLYMFMHHRMHSRIVPVKIFYHVGGMEALLGWVSELVNVFLICYPRMDLRIC